MSFEGEVGEVGVGVGKREVGCGWREVFWISTGACS